MVFVGETEHLAAVHAQADAAELAIDKTEHEEPPQLVLREVRLSAGDFRKRGPFLSRARKAAV